MNTGDLSEEFDVEYSFEILSTAKKDNASVSTLADEEENYHPGGRKFSFVLTVCIPKTFIIRPYSLSVLLFEEVPSLTEY